MFENQFAGCFVKDLKLCSVAFLSGNSGNGNAAVVILLYIGNVVAGVNVVLLLEQVLVNNSKVREVCCSECNAAWGGCHTCEFFAICINDGHLAGVSVISTCEGQLEYNCCAIVEYIGVGLDLFSVKVEPEIVSDCAAGSCKVKTGPNSGTGQVIEANLVVVMIVLISSDQLLHHCMVESNRNITDRRCEYECVFVSFECFQQLDGHCKAEL